MFWGIFKEKMKDTGEIGWKEWVALPSLGIPAIKAKIDTGARTSALHTFSLETYRSGDQDMVRFLVHPLQNRTKIQIECFAPVLDKRIVRDSGGHAEERYVIYSDIVLGTRVWPIEITLTSRDDMLFRMLLGRTAIRDGHFTVNPDKTYLSGKSLKSVYKKNTINKMVKK